MGGSMPGTSSFPAMRISGESRVPARFMAIVCFLAALTLTAAPGAPAAAQTLFGAPPATRQEHAGPSAPSALSPLMRFRIWVRTAQRDLHRQLAGALKRLKDGEELSAAWLLAGLSFFYGIVHAAGPGHGKAVISSYVLANERTVRRGIALSFLASLMQALTAVVVVTVLAVLLDAAGLKIKDAARSLEIASYVLVVAVGVWLVWAALLRIRTRRVPVVAQIAEAQAHHDHKHGEGCGHGYAHHRHEDDHGHGDHCGHAHLPDANQVAGITGWKSAAAIVLAVGLRPCTGALLVLVFAFANGLYLAGVGATFAMSLGTAITVSVLAVLAVTSRELALRLAGPGSGRAERIFDFAALGGGLLVLALGIILVAGSMEPARPF